MKKNYSKTTIMMLAIALVLFMGAGCNQSEDNDVVDESQKTLEEKSGQAGDISYEKTAGFNEEIDINFRMRDYKDAPDDYNSIDEMRETLIDLEGKATIKVLDIGTTKEIGKIKKAAEGKTFVYVIYEITGAEKNQTSLTIQPRRHDQTGWDPAPQFVTIIDGEDDYGTFSSEDILLEANGYEGEFGGIEFNQNETKQAAANWQIDENQDYYIALKYIDMDGNSKYIKIEQQ